MKKDKTKSGKVGYKNPPKHTRFKKGQSGNPKGRPKKDNTLAAILQNELDEEIIITEGGVSVKVTKLEALIKSLFANAIKGKQNAINALLKLFSESNKKEEILDGKQLFAQSMKLAVEQLEAEHDNTNPVPEEDQDE